MRKFFLILVIFFIASQSVLSNPLSSNNTFEIPIDSVPPGSSTGGSNGLSGGAVTAITLGSVFGGAAALGGLGWYFANKSGLACGYASGCECPYSSISITDNSILEKLKLNNDKNNYLIKAFKYIKHQGTSSEKYLLVQDMNIKNKTFNTIFFDLPNSKELNKVKIIQVSEPYSIKNNLPALDSKIIINPKSKKPIEIPTTVVQNDSQNGILIKQGVIKNYENKTAALVTENKMDNPKNYSIIIQFSN